MKTLTVIAAVAACSAFAAPTAPTAKPVQRTLAALEASTAERPAHVRMLFYGQSIVAQRWHTNVVAELKWRYPTAVLEVENRAIGGFTSPDLIRTAESDLYPYYPDILFFHVYGPTDKYEDIVRKARETTTAEIVLWTSHLNKHESRSREAIEKMLGNPDSRSKKILEIAERYGCLAIDLRSKWCRMMLDDNLKDADLLKDGIHMRTDGPALGSYAKFISEELVRIPGDKGDASFSGTIVEIPVTDRRVKRRADGSLVLKFSGNRVVAVSDGRGSGECRVTLDSRAPADFSEMYYYTRPSTLVSWMPMVKHVDIAPGVKPVIEDWTLTYIDGTEPFGNPVHYKVEGSVTGFDGEGWNTNDFRSVSGRALISTNDFHTWQYGYFVQKQGRKDKDSKPGQKVTWSVRPLYADPYAAAPAGARTALVQNCANGAHTLVVKPAKGGKCGIGSFVVYSPADPAKWRGK